jgi:SsrA-binding protein
VIVTSKSKKKTQSAGQASKGKATPKASAAPTIKVICDNRKAKHKYEILDGMECGVMLVGSEVKSLRNGKCELDEAYGRVRGDTLWLVGCDIAEYPQATVWNHEPKRPRQLLVHKREMLKFIGRANEKGLTLVPLRMYFNERGIVKCEMALCKGLRLHDKREKLKKSDAQRDIARAVRRKN